MSSTGFGKTVNSLMTVTKGIRRRGERGISRKAIAQGRPDALRWTCMLMRALFVHIAHGTAGAARTRSSLRPLFGEGERYFHNSGRNALRERKATPAGDWSRRLCA